MQMLRGLTDSPVELREANGNPVIAGYAALYNSPSQDLGGFTEVILPGAFDRTLAEVEAGTRDVLARVQHEGGLSVVGRTGNGTLKLWSDKKGLGYEMTGIPNTTAGHDITELVRGGYINKSSFAFEVRPNGKRWDRSQNPPRLELLDVDLVDVAPVDRPAYEATSVQMRAAMQREIPGPNSKIVDLYIYDQIMPTWISRYMTDTMSAGEIVEALEAAPDAELINVNINSPGGDVFEAMTMYETLRAHPARVNVTVQGLAASAAGIVAMAGDTIQIARGGFFMVHNAWSGATGNAYDMRSAADLLDKIDLSIAGIISARTGTDSDQVLKWMNAETWFTSDESLANGFADRVTGTAELEDGDGERCRAMGFRRIPDSLGGPAPEKRVQVTNAERAAVLKAQIRATR